MTVFLQTRRLTLRVFTADDVDLLVELDSDPDVMRYISNGELTPREEIEVDIFPAFLDYYRRFTGYGFWGAVSKSTDEFLGWFHLRPVPGDLSDQPELGYRLRRGAWGHGYATEGSRALIARGFTEFGVRRVVASTMAVHAASCRVLERSGLCFVRTFVADWPVSISGDQYGDVEYAITRAEWESDELARVGRTPSDGAGSGSDPRRP